MKHFKSTEPTQEEAARVAQIYAMRQIYWPAYTWLIQTKHLNNMGSKKEALEANGVDVAIFNARKSDLFNKVNASFYHLQKLKENELAVIKLGKRIAKKSKEHLPRNVLGIVGIPYEPIDYEYEALLVTLKSALDIMTMILAQPAGLQIDNIGALLNECQQNKRSSDFMAKIRELVTKEEHYNTIDEFKNKGEVKSKRNYAVHQGSLPTGTINIQFVCNQPKINILKTSTLEIGGEKVDFRKQQTLDDYATNLFYAVCDLIIDGLDILLGETLPKGKKTSVYDERQAQRKILKKQMTNG